MADPAPPVETPELIAAHRAFERGDFYEAHRLAVELERRAADEPARAAADAMLQRLSFDPVVIGLTAGCGIFFVSTLLLTLGR